MAVNITKPLRAWLEKHPEGRLKELYTAFEHVGIRPLNQALTRLERRGEIKLPDPTYQYTKRTDGRKEAKQQEIWYTIQCLAQVKREINVDELIFTSEVSEDYVRKYILFLERQGYVARRKTGLAIFQKALERYDAPVWTYRPGKKKAAA